VIIGSKSIEVNNSIESEHKMEAVKQGNHYINNQEFLAALIAYRTAVEEAAQNGEERPQVPEYIGECFIKIARHLSYKSNFINYSFKDEMISDAIENCLSVVSNFDPAKSKNPFAYFTQITFYAFVRRIQREKKQLETKYRYIDQLDLNEIITQEHDNGEFQNQFIDYLKNQIDGYDYARVVSLPVKVESTPEDVAQLEFQEDIDKQDKN
jgi:hypothetical protein